MTLSVSSLPDALHAALYFATFYFVVALLTGVWKWRAMLASPDGQAHTYIDIGHHAALHYGPFILLAGILASLWPFSALMPGWVLIYIMGWTMVLSLSRYISLGLKGATSNQLYQASNSAKFGLLFFFFGSVLPGVAIAVGAVVGL